MSREIKFRAWHKSDEVMLQVGDDYGTTHPLDCCKYAMDGQPVELSQYADYKDADGVEVYEGDRIELRHSGRQFTIGFINAQFTLCDSAGERYCSLCDIPAKNLTVIGNKWEGVK